MGGGGCGSWKGFGLEEDGMLARGAGAGPSRARSWASGPVQQAAGPDRTGPQGACVSHGEAPCTLGVGGETYTHSVTRVCGGTAGATAIAGSVGPAGISQGVGSHGGCLMFFPKNICPLSSLRLPLLCRLGPPVLSLCPEQRPPPPPPPPQPLSAW